MRAHVIVDGLIVNTIKIESIKGREDLIDADAGGKMGDSYDPKTGNFISPEPKPEPKKELTGRELIESLDNDELIKLVDFLQLQNVLTDKRATKIKGGA